MMVLIMIIGPEESRICFKFQMKLKESFFIEEQYAECDKDKDNVYDHD